MCITVEVTNPNPSKHTTESHGHIYADKWPKREERGSVTVHREIKMMKYFQ